MKKLLTLSLALALGATLTLSLGSCDNHTHTWTDADCTNPKTCYDCGATEGDALGHKPETDDGDCTTEVKCTVCDTVTTYASADHMKYSGDMDCTTPVTCYHCDYVFEEGEESHAFNYDRWSSVVEHHGHACTNYGCAAMDGIEEHSGEDDGDCTTWVLCKCGWLVKEANGSHTPEEDDGDCTTAVGCSVCDQNAIAAREKHDWVEGVCSVCETERVIYLDTSAAASGNVWNDSIDVYFYDSNGDYLGLVTVSQTDGVYIITDIPDEAVQIDFFDLWEGKTTATMTIEAGCNMFTLDGNTDADGKNTGTWSKYNP